MVNINDLKQLIKTQNQSWIKVDNYEFLYQKMGGEEMIKIGSKGNGTNDVYVDILENNISLLSTVTRFLTEEGKFRLLRITEGILGNEHKDSLHKHAATLRDLLAE